MAKTKSTSLRERLTSILPPRRIRRLARESGAVQRHRKLDVVAFVYALALGFSVGHRRTLAGLRRCYERITDSAIARSAFYDRFTAGMAKLMRQLVDEALQKLARRTPRLRHSLRHFRELLAVDSSIIRLHPALADHYPSVWSHHSPAAFKLTLLLNVVGRGPKTFRLSPGKTHDLHLLKPGAWLRGKLLLFDLGFFRCELFDAIGSYGGYFLTRLKRGLNPVIVASHQAAEQRFVGQPLKEVLACLSGETVDFDVAMQWRPNPKTAYNTQTSHYRIIGIWHDDTSEYRFYATNVPRRQLPPQHAAAIYAARWEVELFFRELKTLFRGGQTPSKNRHVSECLLYATLLAVALSRRLLRAVATRMGQAHSELNIDRWARLVTSLTQDLLELIFCPRRYRAALERRLLRLLLREAPDPNRSRLGLLQRAQLGWLACEL